MLNCFLSLSYLWFLLQLNWVLKLKIYAFLGFPSLQWEGMQESLCFAHFRVSFIRLTVRLGLFCHFDLCLLKFSLFCVCTVLGISLGILVTDQYVDSCLMQFLIIRFVLRNKSCTVYIVIRPF